MRGTLHLVTRRDYPLFWAALHEMPVWYDEEPSRSGRARAVAAARSR